MIWKWFNYNYTFNNQPYLDHFYKDAHDMFGHAEAVMTPLEFVLKCRGRYGKDLLKLDRNRNAKAESKEINPADEDMDPEKYFSSHGFHNLFMSDLIAEHYGILRDSTSRLCALKNYEELCKRSDKLAQEFSEVVPDEDPADDPEIKKAKKAAERKKKAATKKKNEAAEKKKKNAEAKKVTKKKSTKKSDSSKISEKSQKRARDDDDEDDSSSSEEESVAKVPEKETPKSRPRKKPKKQEKKAADDDVALELGDSLYEPEVNEQEEEEEQEEPPKNKTSSSSSKDAEKPKKRGRPSKKK